MKWFTIVAASGLAVACLNAQPAEPPKNRAYAGQAIGAISTVPMTVPDSVHFISSEFSWNEKIVKGQPYSAEAVTETNQSLADGNKISRKNTQLVYRDSEGRTRREQTLEAVGPWSSAKPHKTIFINDPVAGVNYILNPDEKIATKMTVPKMDRMMFRNGEGSTQSFGVAGAMVAGVPARRVEVARTTRSTTTTTSSSSLSEPAEDVTIQAAPPMLPRMMIHKMETPNDQTRSESLGNQVIEGVMAEGSRSTTTIPAGQIGNERPIEIVSERWYSPEIEAEVLNKRNDPRVGETIYRLTNIQRSEPEHSLFEPPSGYTINEGPRPFELKVDKAKE